MCVRVHACACACACVCVCVYRVHAYVCMCKKYGGCVNQHLWVSGRVTLLDLEAIGEWEDLEHAKQGGL